MYSLFHTIVKNDQTICSKLEPGEYYAIRKLFLQKQLLTKQELFEALSVEMAPKFSYSFEEFSNCFRRMDRDEDNKVSWDDFIDHVLFELRLKSNLLRIETTDYSDQVSSPSKIQITGKIHTFKRKERSRIVGIHFFPFYKKNFVRSLGVYLLPLENGKIEILSSELTQRKIVQLADPLNRLIFNVIPLPDIEMFGLISSSESFALYDLQFLKVRCVIREMPIQVTCGFYHFCKGPADKKESTLVLGGSNGKVMIMVFTGKYNPFYTTMDEVSGLTFEEFRAKYKDEVQISCYNCHKSSWITKVYFCATMEYVISASNQSTYAAGRVSTLAITPLNTQRKGQKFNFYKDIKAMHFDPKHQVLVTGGVDQIVRKWSIQNPKKPDFELKGHEAAIVGVYYHNFYNQIISFSRDGVILVWNALSQTCIQTYKNLKEMSFKIEPSFHFCEANQSIVIAESSFVIVPFGDMRQELSIGGFSYPSPIKFMVYSFTKDILLVCYEKADIQAWDIYRNIVLYEIKDAHSTKVLDEKVTIDISVLSIGSEEEYFMTGAMDGSVKVWLLYSKDLIKSTQLSTVDNPQASHAHVKVIFLLNGRLLVGGWNKEILEIDMKNNRSTYWGYQNDHVTTAAVRKPDLLISCHVSGDIIFWKLDLAQPFKKFNIKQPTSFRQTGSLTESEKIEHKNEKSSSERLLVTVAILLQTRMSVHPSVGILLLATSNGFIQCWNTFGFLHKFRANVYKSGFVTCMTTDDNEKYLFTGISTGHIKVWLIENYFNSSKQKISMPKLRFQFPFLWKSLFKSKAEIDINQNEMKDLMLVNAFKAHQQQVSGLVYISKREIIITGSFDKTIRLWHLSGIFIGTLGNTSDSVSIPEATYTPKPPYKIPLALKRNLSLGSTKVFTREIPSHTFQEGEKPYIRDCPLSYREKEEIKKKDIAIDKIYGKRRSEPILGKHWNVPKLDLPFPNLTVNQDSIKTIFNQLKGNDITEKIAEHKSVFDHLEPAIALRKLGVFEKNNKSNQIIK